MSWISRRDLLRLSSICGVGLAASTLVQRFATKAGLMQATLLHAWDRLETGRRREDA